MELDEKVHFGRFDSARLVGVESCSSGLIPKSGHGVRRSPFSSPAYHRRCSNQKTWATGRFKVRPFDDVRIRLLRKQR